MINKFEAVGIFLSVSLMASALYILNFDAIPNASDTNSQASAVVSVSDDRQLSDTILDAVDNKGKVMNLIIDDILIGEGASVKEGDTISVHYIGTLQNGQQFDNSYLKGVPFTFMVGTGEVIKGWDQGVVGMKVGGQRIIVVPAELAYGAQGVGPIPGNATLVFAIELLSIE